MRDHQQFEETVLPNGIRLFSYQDSFPICCMELQLPVGIGHSIAENGFLPGSAHFLEHTQLIRSQDFPQAYASDKALGLKGGNSNAATQLKTTTHWIDTPTGEQQFGASMLMNRVFKSVFSEEDVAIERSVVANERGQNKFYPGKSKTSQYYFRDFIDDVYCPLEQIFGSDEDLAQMDVARLEAMHQAVTSSNTITALAVGPDDFSFLKEELGRLPVKETTFASQTSPTTWNHKDYHIVYFDTVPQPRLEVAWVHPRLPYLEYRAVCFIINLLINTTQGPLHHEFREEKGWTYGLDAICSLRESNLIAGLTFPVNTIDQVDFIRECLADRIEKAVSNQQLVEDEITRQRGIQVYNYQSAGSIISAASSSLVSHGHIYTEAEFLESLEAMRKPEWRNSIVERYFKPEDMGSVCFLPDRRDGR